MFYRVLLVLLGLVLRLPSSLTLLKLQTDEQMKLSVTSRTLEDFSAGTLMETFVMMSELNHKQKEVSHVD